MVEQDQGDQLAMHGVRFICLFDLLGSGSGDSAHKGPTFEDCIPYKSTFKQFGKDAPETSLSPVELYQQI